MSNSSNFDDESSGNTDCYILCEVLLVIFVGMILLYLRFCCREFCDLFVYNNDRHSHNNSYGNSDNIIVNSDTDYTEISIEEEYSY